MKKVLSILLVLLVLVGCSEKESVTVIKDKNESENFSLANYKSFKIESAISVEAYYGENRNIVQYSVLKNETGNEVNLGLDNKPVEEAVNIIMEQISSESEIKFTSEDEEINEIVKNYVETKNVEQEVYVNEELINAASVSLFDFSNIGDYGALIYKSTKWTNREDVFNGPIFNDLPNVGSYDVIVFSPQYTGFYIRYISELVYPKTTTFTWDEDGNINFDYGIVNEIYNLSGKVDHYENFFGGNDMYHETFTIQEDGKIKTIVDEERAEYIYFEKEQSFKQPFDSIQKLKDVIGRSPSQIWTTMPELENVWYEPKYTNYSDDYNGIKKYASTIWPR